MPFDKNDLLNIDRLRETGAKPEWFGLGFIQLKLNATQRMHIWHPSLTPDVDEEEIHDHRYTFVSEILKGKMTHQTYEFDGAAFGNSEMLEVSCDPANPLVNPRRISGNSRTTGLYELVEGSRYRFEVGQFHRALTTFCISLVTIDTPAEEKREHARVIRKKGAKEICPFSNPMPEEKLWTIIADALAPQQEEPTAFIPGYHLSSIQKGVPGEPSKIFEECEEFMDSIDQGVSIMALVELADMLGAVELYLAKHHPTITLNDLKSMSDVTKRAFQNGHRR